MRRLALAALLALPLFFGAACGGGGGDDEPVPCTAPGVLRALAVQGAPAVGTAGSFGAFPVDLLLDVAPGGWAVFEAATSDPLNAACVHVAQPDGSLLKVFATGETVPAPGNGTISDFLVVRVNAAGQVLVEVAITGDSGGRDFGLLTAQVVGGVVTSKAALVYEGHNMGPSGVAGTLTDIDESRVWFQADGRTFFGGTTSTPHEAAWVVNLDGTGLDDLLATGDILPDGPGSAVCLDIKALGVSGDGSRFAFVSDVGGPFEDRLYVGNTGTTTILEVASDGNALPGGGVVQEIHGGGELLAFNNGFVLWQAEGSTAASDDVVLYGSAFTPYVELARTADPAPGSGGFFGELRLVNHRQQCLFPAVDADLLLVPGGAGLRHVRRGQRLAAALDLREPSGPAGPRRDHDLHGSPPGPRRRAARRHRARRSLRLRGADGQRHQRDVLADPRVRHLHAREVRRRRARDRRRHLRRVLAAGRPHLPRRRRALPRAAHHQRQRRVPSGALTRPAGRLPQPSSTRGEVAERSKARAWKARIRETVSQVQILSSPPFPCPASPCRSPRTFPPRAACAREGKGTATGARRHRWGVLGMLPSGPDPVRQHRPPGA
jgi:hypothetical protein